MWFADFKLRWYELLTYGAVLLSPIYPAMLAVTFVLAIDWITGMWAAYKSGAKITSRRMSDTITKVILYNLLIITALIVEKFLFTQIPFTRLAVGFVGLVELKSVSENITAITKVDFWKALITWFKRKGVDQLDGTHKEPNTEHCDEESTETKE